MARNPGLLTAYTPYYTCSLERVHMYVTRTRYYRLNTGTQKLSGHFTFVYRSCTADALQMYRKCTANVL